MKHTKTTLPLFFCLATSLCSSTASAGRRNIHGLTVKIPNSTFNVTHGQQAEIDYVITQATHILRQHPRHALMSGYATIFNAILKNYYRQHPEIKPYYQYTKRFRTFVNACKKRCKTPHGILSNDDMWEILDALEQDGTLAGMTGITPTPLHTLPNVLIINADYLTPALKSQEMVNMLSVAYDDKKDLLQSTALALANGEEVYVIVDPHKHSSSSVDNPGRVGHWFLVALRFAASTYRATIFEPCPTVSALPGVVSAQDNKWVKNVVELLHALLPNE